MRIFTAIALSAPLKEYLSEIQRQIKPYAAKGNFTIPENLHLTLRFIGESTERESQAVLEAMKATAIVANAFTLQTSKLGCFRKGNKLILWLGLEASHSLNMLFEQLELNLVQQGFQREERPYRPHLTLGREIVLTEDFENIKNIITLEKRQIRVDQLTLMESKRINGKLAYVPIQQAPLHS